MVWVLSVRAGSATTFRRVRSMPMPASASTAAMFTFCGKCGTPSRAGPSNRVSGAVQAVEVDAERLDIGNALPGRGRLGDLDRDLVHAGEAGGLQRVQAADAARRDVEQRAAAPRRRFGRRAQRVVGQRAGGQHDDADAGFEQRHQMLAHRLVRSGLEHRLRARREQRLAPDHVGNAELARQRARRASAAPRPASAMTSIPGPRRTCSRTRRAMVPPPSNATRMVPERSP